MNYISIKTLITLSVNFTIQYNSTSCVYKLCLKLCLKESVNLLDCRVYALMEKGGGCYDLHALDYSESSPKKKGWTEL